MTPRPVPAPVSDTTAARALAHHVRDARRAMASYARDCPFTDVRAELARWRAVDRAHTSDTAEWWFATLRLRDIADRAESETRA